MNEQSKTSVAEKTSCVEKVYKKKGNMLIRCEKSNAKVEQPVTNHMNQKDAPTYYIPLYQDLKAFSQNPSGWQV